MVCYNNEIIELFNKISSEINSKFDGIHFEITTMKSAISTLNNKLDKNTELLKKLDTELNIILERNNLDIDTSYAERLNSINSNIVNSSKDTSLKLTTISKDLKFITHKVMQTEQDLFNIQEEFKNED